jgi:hypothetical protein
MRRWSHTATLCGPFKDKLYGIKLNHVPCKYNEEVDELANIASGWITVPLNVFARDVARRSVDLRAPPSS